MYEAELVALRKRRQPVLVRAMRCSLEASWAGMGLMDTMDMRSVSSGEALIMWAMSRRQWFFSFSMTFARRSGASMW